MLSFKTQPINFCCFANLYITSTKASRRHLGQLKSALSHIIILSTLQLFPALLWTDQRILKALDIPIIWLSPLTAMGAGENRSQALCSWIHLNVTPPPWASVTVCGAWIWMTGFNKRTLFIARKRKNRCRLPSSKTNYTDRPSEIKFYCVYSIYSIVCIFVSGFCISRVIAYPHKTGRWWARGAPGILWLELYFLWRHLQHVETH